MASDDEPMKVSIQQRNAYEFTWQMLVFLLTIAVGFAAIEIAGRHVFALDSHSPRSTNFLVLMVGPMSLFGPKLKSIRTFFSMFGVYMLAGIVCYAIVQVMFIILVDVEPICLKRFLLYLPVSPLMLLVIPQLVAKLHPPAVFQKSTLKPVTIASGTIAMAGILAGGDWLFDVLTQAGN